MDLKEANNELERIDNQINYYLEKKEMELVRATKITSAPKEIVSSGGIRVDKFASYVIKSEKYDPILDDLYRQKVALERYIDSELERLKKYDEVVQLIVYYKEQAPNKYTWYQISQKVHYSISQCKKIYKKYIGKRIIKNEPM